MSYWWGHRDSDTGKDVLSKRGRLEGITVYDTFKSGNTITLEGNDRGSSSQWDQDILEIVKLDYGFDSNNLLYFLVTFRFMEKTGQGHMQRWEDQQYTIKVVYLRDYPARAPVAYYIKGGRSVLDVPHLYPGGNLCLFNPNDGRGLGWNPSSNTGASIILWAMQWIQAYRHWQLTNKWPGEDGHS